MDIEIVSKLLERMGQASEILQTDSSFPAQVQAYDDAEPGHRHRSHLWVHYPGSQITLDHTPELAMAAQTTGSALG